MATYQGYRIRNSLARSVYERMLQDERERYSDHSEWYKVNVDLLSADVCDKFIEFHQDSQTSEFLDHCYAKSDWVFTQLFHLLVKAVLGWVMSNTSINGLLGRGSMFVCSTCQFETLMGVDSLWRSDCLLDIGAGDGHVTRVMAPYFRQVFVTEMSPTMRRRLSEKGYSLLGIHDWQSGNRSEDGAFGEAGLRKFDLISCLNVLDRCSRPLELLRQIRESLVPGTGRALIAVVLPLSQFVEYAKSSAPEEYLDTPRKSFEGDVVALIRNVFEPAGFEVLRYTRVPYLCEGDMRSSYFVLSDAVFLLKLKST